MTSDEENSEEENNPRNPFGEDFNPQMISDMVSQLFSGMQGGAGSPSNDPLNVAKQVASEIASLETEELPSNAAVADEVPQQADPMQEIMGALKFMSSSKSDIPALKIDENFTERCAQIYPAAQAFVMQHSASEDVTELPLVVTDRVTWSRDYISSLQGPLSEASKSLNPTFGMDQAQPNEFGIDIQSIIANTVAPVLFGFQAGTMLGYLSHRAYGDDDVLLPASLTARVAIIGSAVQKFADDWSISNDDAILYFLILQTLRAHVRKSGWLTAKLNDLCTRYVAAYELNPYKLEELMSDIDFTNPESINAVSVTPAQMFETLRTPTHDILDEEIGRISSLHDAYIEWLMHKDLETLLPHYSVIQEARHRITVTTSEADRFVEQLFGVATTVQDRSKANSFIEGAMEREGEKYLHKMWQDEKYFPTSSEYEAPGLWLARIELM